MDHSVIHIGDVGKLLRRVVDDWRLGERKAIRDRLRDFDDKFEKLDYRASQSGSEEMRTSLQERFDEYKSRIDAKYAMIDEAHRQMVEYLGQCEPASD